MAQILQLYKINFIKTDAILYFEIIRESRGKKILFLHTWIIKNENSSILYYEEKCKYLTENWYEWKIRKIF